MPGGGRRDGTRPERGSARQTAGARPGRGGQVQSLQRAMRLLGLLADAHEGLTLGELAEMAGLPLSTTHRLLTTLQSARFVRFDPAEALWQVGVQAFVVGSAFRRARDLQRLARPFMRPLVTACGETANLWIEDEAAAVCVTQVECPQFVRAIARPGGRARLHASAAGKVLLAWKSDAGLSAFLAGRALERLTGHTIVRPLVLRARLQEIRRRGFAVDDEESAEGVRCVAAPVFDETREVVAALSISGPKSRLHDAAVERFAPLVRTTALEITAAFGGRAPDPAATRGADRAGPD